MIINSHLDELTKIFPEYIRKKLQKNKKKKDLVEIIIDIGRRPEARFLYGIEYLSKRIISWKDIYYCIKQISVFNTDNRAGIDRTLHRISCIRNQQGLIIGLTCRVGRNIIGTISLVRDLLELKQSLLILGKPGVGKTTTVREISRVLAEEMNQRVIIVDTSNEIAGNTHAFYSGIGKARRMQICNSLRQHQTMIEAVENHTPQVIVIDEIGTKLETLAARTIAERGVQLIGTAHGNSLDSLIKNPILNDLIGGIQIVTLSDEQARKQKKTKSIQERKTKPSFNIVIEIKERNIWTIHSKVVDSVDFFLGEKETIIEIRVLKKKQTQKILCCLYSLYRRQDLTVIKEKEEKVQNSVRTEILPKAIKEDKSFLGIKNKQNIMTLKKKPLLERLQTYKKWQLSISKEFFCETFFYLFIGKELNYFFTFFNFLQKLSEVNLKNQKIKNLKFLLFSYKIKNITNKKNIIFLQNFRNNYLFKKKFKEKKIIHIYGFSSLLIKKISNTLNIFIVFTPKMQKADIIISSKQLLTKNKKLYQVAKSRKIPLYGINPKIIGQLTRSLYNIVQHPGLVEQ